LWDAYDNYHDHDERWTIYGLLRYGQGIYTPKKRYFGARMYGFAAPVASVPPVTTRACRRSLVSPDGATDRRLPHEGLDDR
jgi:hypothetical protein